MVSEDPTFEQALGRMVGTADALPGAFSAEFALVYQAGVIGPGKWACDVEADIYGTTFRVLGDTPQQAIGRAITEAWRRVPGEANPESGVVLRRSGTGTMLGSSRRCSSQVGV